jgi:hypothetical protein
LDERVYGGEGDVDVGGGVRDKIEPVFKYVSIKATEVEHVMEFLTRCTSYWVFGGRGKLDSLN